MQLLCDLPATMMIPLPPRTLVRGGRGTAVALFSDSNPNF